MRPGAQDTADGVAETSVPSRPGRRENGRLPFPPVAAPDLEVVAPVEPKDGRPLVLVDDCAGRRLEDGTKRMGAMPGSVKPPRHELVRGLAHSEHIETPWGGGHDRRFANQGGPPESLRTGPRAIELPMMQLSEPTYREDVESARCP